MPDLSRMNWGERLKRSPYYGVASASETASMSISTSGQTDWMERLKQSPYYGIADVASAKPTEDLDGARIANAVMSGAHSVAIPGAGQYRGGVGSTEGRLDTYNLLDHLTDDQRETIKGFADKKDYAAVRKYYEELLIY